MNRYIFIVIIIGIIIYILNYNNLLHFTNQEVDRSNIYIVYFIYINPDRNWKLILEGQMNDINKTNILENNKLFVVISSNDENNTNEAKKIINTILINYIHNIDFTVESRNLYEYFGIKKVYDLACLNKHKLFIYFHSKGMKFHSDSTRNIDEQKLTKYTFNDWEHILSIFKNNSNIQKVGLFPSDEGWVWFNFWWSRGEYISNLKEPIISEDRYYYETWLKPDTYNICNDAYSTIYKETKCFNQPDTVNEINKINYNSSSL
jgi:hypothetical protein